MQRLVKCFMFEEAIRSKLTFSDATKIRLDSKANRLALKGQSVEGSSGRTLYPTDTDLTVTLDATSPTAVVQWVGFSAEPHPSRQPDGTVVQYKLNDGTDDRFWDGGTWAVAGATDWNDEATVVANIATYPSRTLSLVINLATTDPYVTPTLSFIDLLMECDLDYLRSIIADAVIPSLRASITPTIDYVLYAEGSTLLSLLDLETAFNIKSVVAVYDHTNDADHTTNLFDSFDAASKLVTLNAAPERGTALWLRFCIEPEVYLNWPSQDYLEVEKLPAVVLDSFLLAGNEVYGNAQVRDIGANTASVRRSPFRLQMSFEVVLLAEKNRTLLAMMDKALEHAATTRLLHWPACDEQISLTMLEEGNFAPRPNLSDKHQSRYTLRLDDVFLWLRPEEVIPLVQRVNLSLLTPGLQGGPRWTGVASGGSPQPSGDLPDTPC